MTELTPKEFVSLEILKALIASNGKGIDNYNLKYSYAAVEMADVILGERPK